MPNRFPFNTPNHPEDNRSINKAFDRNYGNRLKSGDTTTLKYTIKDGDGEPLDKERFPNMQTSLILKYEGVTAYKTEFEATLEEVTENYVGDLVARFRIDEALPPSDTPYVVEFHFEDDEDLFIFPSVNTLELYITPSALNSDEEAIKSISDQRLNEIIERKLEENPVLSEAEANELARQENYQELLDTGVMQTKINERLEDLEEEYAPKLTEVTAQLAQTASSKVDKNGSMQVNYGNLAQDVREKLTGDKVGVVGVESTGQTNLTQNAVSEFETSVVEKSKNLFNLNNLVRDHTLHASTGGYIELPNISSTKDWIRVTPGEKLYKNFHGTWTFADESFNVLGGQGNNQPPGIIEIPSNAYFIKVSSRNSELVFAQLEYGEIETPFVSGDFRFKEGMKFTGHDLDRESVDFSKFTGLVTSSNLLTPRKLITGVYVRFSDGALLSASGNSTFENIYIPKNTETLRVHEFASGTVNYIFINDEGVRVSGGRLETTSEKTLSVPPNAVFLTISFINSEISRAMVSVGSQEKAYEPYYKYFEEILEPKSDSEGQDGGSINFDKFTGLVTSNNLLNPRKLISGVYVRTSDGALTSASNNSSFDDVYIPRETETLRVHEFTTGVVNYVLKSSEGNRVAGGALETTSEKTIPVPENAVLLSISFANSEIPQAMVSVGSQVKAYEPYYKYFEDILEPKSDNETQEGSRLAGQTGVAFGDSLTGMYPDNVAYPNRVKDELGLEDYINVGFSGTRMSGGAPINHKDFSLPSLVDSVISGDYTLQNESVNLELGMYETHLNNLKNIDWLNVDFVSIFYGANDYSGGVVLDNEDDLYDKTTFKGGLRYAIKELSTKYPHLKFIIITPSFIPTRENTENNAGLLTDDYVQGTIDVQEELSTGLINLFHNGQINRFNYATYLQQDALHFNHSTGLERVSELIGSQLLVYL